MKQTVTSTDMFNLMHESDEERKALMLGWLRNAPVNCEVCNERITSMFTSRTEGAYVQYACGCTARCEGVGKPMWYVTEACPKAHKMYMDKQKDS